MICNICESDRIYSKYQLYDDRYGYPGYFNLHGCNSCNHAYLKKSLSEQDLIELYTQYYPRREMNVEDYKPIIGEKGFKSWLNGFKSGAYSWVPGKVKVLDIGCGFGEALGYHKQRGCEVYGIEADKNVQRVAEKYGYDVQQGLFHAELYENDFFDYVTMDQVIEHINDPIQVLHDIAEILKPNGKAILSTPNNQGWGAKVFRNRWINWHVPYHVQLFSKKSMQIAARKAGLEVQEIYTVTNSEWLRFQWLHLVFYPKPEKASAYWKGDKNVGRSKKFIRIILVILHKLKINHLITRVFDGFKMGDNLVFVLKK